MSYDHRSPSRCNRRHQSNDPPQGEPALHTRSDILCHFEYERPGCSARPATVDSATLPVPVGGRYRATVGAAARGRGAVVTHAPIAWWRMDGRKRIVIWILIAGTIIELSCLCAIALWAACVAGARTDSHNWRGDLESHWPAMPEGIDGVDLFLEECGPPTGQKEQK